MGGRFAASREEGKAGRARKAKRKEEHSTRMSKWLGEGSAGTLSGQPFVNDVERVDIDLCEMATATSRKGRKLYGSAVKQRRRQRRFLNGEVGIKGFWTAEKVVDVKVVGSRGRLKAIGQVVGE